jgi:hypothetical protein
MLVSTTKNFLSHTVGLVAIPDLVVMDFPMVELVVDLEVDLG